MCSHSFKGIWNGRCNAAGIVYMVRMCANASPAPFLSHLMLHKTVCRKSISALQSLGDVFGYRVWSGSCLIACWVSKMPSQPVGALRGSNTHSSALSHIMLSPRSCYFNDPRGFVLCSDFVRQHVSCTASCLHAHSTAAAHTASTYDPSQLRT